MNPNACMRANKSLPRSRASVARAHVRQFYTGLKPRATRIAPLQGAGVGCVEIRTPAHLNTYSAFPKPCNNYELGWDLGARV